MQWLVRADPALCPLNEAKNSLLCCHKPKLDAAFLEPSEGSALSS
jgi:hypothetical protein